MKIVASIEARLGSSRLPGKVLLPAAGKPMLHHLVERLRRVPSVDEVVLATTLNPGDRPLEEFAEAAGIRCFRGSEEDVMGRVIAAANDASAELVVEIMGDSPLVDPEIVEQCVQVALHNPCDYASNVVVRSYPMGMGVQVFPLDVLRRSASLTSDPRDREHVTRHIRLNPDLFSHLHLVAPPRLTWPELELTLDEREDYKLLKNVIEHFDGNGGFGCGEVIDLLRSRPEWLAVNGHVQRKGL